MTCSISKADAAARQRALEIYFTNRGSEAARIDAEAGHPFRNALYRKRARREARLLVAEWSEFDMVLGKTALRAALERKHGTTDAPAIKRAMLSESLDRRPFLKGWMQLQNEPAEPPKLLEALKRIARQPNG